MTTAPLPPPGASPPTATVVVCTRDRPELLERALASLVAALPADLPVLVVDSASRTGRTREVALAHGVRYLRVDRPGLSVARNAGLAAAHGDVVLFTDDDCEVGPDWAPALVAGFADPRVGAVTGRMVDEEGERTLVSGTDHVRVFATPSSGLDAGHGASMALRRRAVLDAGGYDVLLGAGSRFPGAEDLDVFVRLVRAGWVVRSEPASRLHHRNQRVGEELVALMRAYGLGAGAMAAKLARLWPLSGGGAVLARVLVRSVRSVARSRSRTAVERRAALAGLAATLRGAAAGARLRLDGECFADPGTAR